MILADFEYAELLAKLPKNADGKPVCACGALLSGRELREGECHVCDQEKQIAREKAWRKERDLERIDGAAAAALLSIPVGKWARFRAPEIDKLKAQEIGVVARRWTPTDGPIFFSGPTGIGKTSYAAAMIRSVVSNAHHAAKAAINAGAEWKSAFRAATDLKWTNAHALAQARRHHRLGEGEAPLVQEAKDHRLLVIDELGFEPLDTVIFEIADARYLAGAPTVVTTGLTVEQFRARYGDACFRRFAELGTVVEEWGAGG